MDLTGVLIIAYCVAHAGFVIWLKVKHPEKAKAFQARLERGNQQYQSMMGGARKTAGKAAVKATLFGFKWLMK